MSLTPLKHAYTCPCCGYKVFDEAPGSYDICPICGWEDDLVQLKAPKYAGGANKLSLIKYQEKFGQPRQNVPFSKDENWRPINPEIDLEQDGKESAYYWED